MSILYVVKTSRPDYITGGLVSKIIGLFRDKNKANTKRDSIRAHSDYNKWSTDIEVEEVETDLF